MQREYTCYTNKGKWNFYADDDISAARLALYYAWRDDEQFIRIERRNGCEHYSLRIAVIDHNNKESFTL